MKREKKKQIKEKESNSYWLPIGLCFGFVFSRDEDSDDKK